MLRRVGITGILLSAVSFLTIGGIAVAVGQSSIKKELGKATNQHLATVSINYAPIAGQAPVVIAQTKGYFRAKGLVVQNVDAPSATIGMDNLIGGKQQFALGNIGSVAVAMSQGFPLKVIAPLYYSATTDGIYVSSASHIKSISELAGKTVALGTLGNDFEAVVDQDLVNAGVSPSHVKYSLIPLPDGAQTLAAGKATAAQVIEPGITAAGSAIRPLIRNVWRAALGSSDALVGVLMTTKTYARTHPQIVKEFLAAYDQGLHTAGTNAGILRQTVASLTKLPRKLVDRLRLPIFKTSYTVKSASKQLILMKKFGLLNKNFNISGLTSALR
jgi:NitT/TauT family transport system substrate-binding protein